MIRRFVELAPLTAALIAGPASPASSQPPADTTCGTDLSTSVIARAVASLRPPFPNMDVAWNPVPYGGNFNPCATLSTALVTVEDATGSSPDHVLLFHFGAYLGTATWEPYPFTSLNIPLTTDDTIVLEYKDGRYVCTACPGPVTIVRYQWQRDHVEMLDPAPPGP